MNPISPENQEALLAEFREAGFQPGDKVTVSGLISNHRDLYNMLLRETRKQGNDMVGALLQSLKFSIDYHYDGKLLLEELVQTLKQIYSIDKIGAALRGKTKLPGRSELEKNVRLVHTYFGKRGRDSHTELPKLPSFRQILDSLYPEYPNLAHIVTGQVKREDFPAAEVGRRLDEAYYNQEDISPTGLRYLNDALLRRWLISHATYVRKKENLFRGRGQCMNLTPMIASLSRIKDHNFSTLYSRNNRLIGSLTEYITGVPLWTALKFDPEGRSQTLEFKESFPLPLIKIFPSEAANQLKRPNVKRPGVKLFIEKKTNKVDGNVLSDKKRTPDYLHADFIAGSFDKFCVVEVKNWRSANNCDLKNVKKRLTGLGELVWRLNSSFLKTSGRTLVVHSRDDVVSKFKKYFSDSKVHVFGASDFKKSLEISLRTLEEKGYLRTHVFSANTIMQMYDVIAERPYILIRKAQQHKLYFFESVTKELLRRLCNNQKVKQIPPIEIYSKKGEIINNELGEFQRFAFSLKELPEKGSSRYLAKRITFMPENAIALDLETTGFGSKENMIFIIGTAYKQDKDIKIDIAFARNPWEEQAVIKYFCELAKNHEYVITYNGETFDYPFLKGRMQTHMIRDALPEGHMDVYKPLRKPNFPELESKKQSSIGTYLFGDPPRDSKGRDAGKIYSQWLLDNSSKGIETMVMHNIADLITTMALGSSPDFGITSSQYQKHIRAQNPLFVFK
ncbi:MAG: ribonuclease H-like domain-containing protein [archaeon]